LSVRALHNQQGERIQVGLLGHHIESSRGWSGGLPTDDQSGFAACNRSSSCSKSAVVGNALAVSVVALHWVAASATGPFQVVHGGACA